MGLFTSSTTRGLGRRTRCTSARTSSTRDGTRQQQPPSPLAQQLTKQKPASGSATPRTSSRRGRHAVHPIDLRNLESELDVLPDQTPVHQKAVCEPERPLLRPFTATIAVLHALDLHNPCQIRSCPHDFVPRVELSVNDTAPVGLDAARHAKNHSSWAKDARITHRIPSDEAAQLHILRVRIAAQCTRPPSKPTLVVIGYCDEIPLSLEPSGTTVSQFYPVFRYQTVQNRVVKYFAGKVKLAISIVPDPEPTLSIPSVVTALNPSPASDRLCCNVVPPLRPSFLPTNFGDALQLKRKQLKATVAPAVANHATSKSHDDPTKAQDLLEKLQARASQHLFRLSDIHVLEAIGDGIHARVFRVRVDGMAIDVAMKEFQYEAAATGALPPLAVLEAFEQEYEMLSLTSSAQSSAHIVSLLGVKLTPRLAIFTDYCSDGSLARCLLDRDTWPRVSWKTKLTLAHQISIGLASLHDNLHMVHRDIKTHNIMVHGLLSQDPIAKIGDLGSAVVKFPTDAMLHDETGSSGYTAPDVFRPQGHDHRADLWSLGVVVWELLLSDPTSVPENQPRNPFVGTCGDDVIGKAERGERPSLPPDCLPLWCEELLLRCWELNPTRRPSAAAIASEVAAHLTTLS